MIIRGVLRSLAVTPASIINIQELDVDGEIVRSWCLTAEDIVTGDVNLAQKIALENFENKALAIANRSSASTWRFRRPSENPLRWRKHPPLTDTVDAALRRPANARGRGHSVLRAQAASAACVREVIYRPFVFFGSFSATTPMPTL
jgi:hypothetical protein